MDIPSAKSISNLVSRKVNIHRKKLNNVICDLQSAVQFCYENSAHRLTQDEYDALPEDKMYYFIYTLHYVYFPKYLSYIYF
jgi:hypothetical protein